MRQNKDLASGHRKYRLSMAQALSALLVMSYAAAEPAPQADKMATHTDGDGVQRLGSVVVVASAHDENGTDASAVKRAEMDRAAAADIKSAVRYQTGVSVGADGVRRGNSGFNIRGISGNRVAMSVDGETLPDGFDWGHEAMTYGRDFIEPDTLHRIDIDKNPAALADNPAALGGTVNFRTYRPQDFVSADKPYYFSFKPSFRSADHGTAATLTGAGQLGATAVMLMYTRRHASETDNRGHVGGSGRTRTLPNPQSMDSHNLLGKLSVGDETRRFDVTVEDFRRETRTEMLSNVGQSMGVLTRDMNAHDQTHRQRFSAGVSMRDLPAFLDRFSLNLYRHNLRHRDHSDARKNRMGSDYIEFMRNGFRQNISGIDTELTGSLQHGSVTQSPRVALHYQHKNTTRPEDRYTLRGGVMAQNPNYPVKWLPDSSTRTLDINLANRIDIGAMSITPALNYRHERISAKDDEAYRRSQPLWMPSYRNHAVTPSLHFAYTVTPTTQLYASYARGRKNPPFDSMAGLSHPPRPPYTVMRFMPNPDLKSEYSDNFAIGTQYHSDALQWKLDVFHNRYRNFINIWGRAISTLPPEMILISDNIDRVSTYGAELSAVWDITPSWQSRLALSWMRGTQQHHGTKQPYDGAQPPKAVLGAGYRQQKWGADIDWTLVAAHHRVGDAKAFKTPGYGILDVSAYWRPHKNIDLKFGVYNLTDKKYFDAADVTLLNRAGIAVSDLYTQPGRSVAGSLTVHF